MGCHPAARHVSSAPQWATNRSGPLCWLSCPGKPVDWPPERRQGRLTSGSRRRESSRAAETKRRKPSEKPGVPPPTVPGPEVQTMHATGPRSLGRPLPPLPASGGSGRPRGPVACRRGSPGPAPISTWPPSPCVCLCSFCKDARDRIGPALTRDVLTSTRPVGSGAVSKSARVRRPWASGRQHTWTRKPCQVPRPAVRSKPHVAAQPRPRPSWECRGETWPLSPARGAPPESGCSL